MKSMSAGRPSSEHAKRVAAIMHRKLTTRWSEKEIIAFRKLVPIDDDDLASLERYYRWHWPPCSDKNVLRHDLGTFLNHFTGESDRAHIWCEAHPIKQPPRKIIPLPIPPEKLITPLEREQMEADFVKLMGRKPRI